MKISIWDQDRSSKDDLVDVLKARFANATVSSSWTHATMTGKFRKRLDLKWRVQCKPNFFGDCSVSSDTDATTSPPDIDTTTPSPEMTDTPSPDSTASPPPLEVLIRPSDVLTVDVSTTVTYFVVHNGGDNVVITWGQVDGSPLPSNTEIGGDYGEQLRIIQTRTTLNIVVRIRDTLGRIASNATTLFVRREKSIKFN